MGFCGEMFSQKQPDQKLSHILGDIIIDQIEQYADDHKPDITAAGTGELLFQRLVINGHPVPASVTVQTELDVIPVDPVPQKSYQYPAEPLADGYQYQHGLVEVCRAGEYLYNGDFQHQEETGDHLGK